MSTPPPPAAVSTTILRPWPQFLNLSALSLPISLSEATYRIPQNLRYFLPNYTLLILILFLLTLITRPLSLILFLCLFAAWAYLVLLRDEPLSLLDYDVDQKIVVGVLSVMTLVAVFWTHVWFKIFVAVVIGALIAVVHAVLRAPEDAVEDSPYGSLLNVVDDDDSRGEYASV